uniref:Uncharacterized protein n=1 Tax=Ascaris lumbricoides TaxID=6252 RepID=A0A0M3HPX8_ASCLU
MGHRTAIKRPNKQNEGERQKDNDENDNEIRLERDGDVKERKPLRRRNQTMRTASKHGSVVHLNSDWK